MKAKLPWREPASTSAVEVSTSKDDLPLISESAKLMIKPLFEALPPERRTVTNLQDALDLATGRDSSRNW